MARNFCLYLLFKLRRYGAYVFSLFGGTMLAYLAIYATEGVSIFDFMKSFVGTLEFAAYGFLLYLPFFVQKIAEDYMRWKWRWLLDV